MILFSCSICKKQRPDEKISVLKRDMGKEHGLEPGVMTEHVQYCNDSPACVEEAQRRVDDQRTG